MSKIEWTDKTWNPIVGCSKVSAGCDNCYAERMAQRQAYMGNLNYLKVVNHIVEDLSGENVVNEPDFAFEGWSGQTAFVESALKKPLHWKKPRKIFVCSMSDIFKAPFEWIDKIFAIAALCPQHTFQILTKRSERMLEYLSWQSAEPDIIGRSHRGQKIDGVGPIGDYICGFTKQQWPLPNVWLGVTAENQAMADKRRPYLKQLHDMGWLTFVSCEPLLSYIDLRLQENWTDWTIIGAESGASRRECSEDWIEDIMRQCNHEDIPVFVKQIHDYEGKIIKSPAGWPREFPERIE